MFEGSLGLQQVKLLFVSQMFVQSALEVQLCPSSQEALQSPPHGMLLSLGEQQVLLGSHVALEQASLALQISPSMQSPVVLFGSHWAHAANGNGKRTIT